MSYAARVAARLAELVRSRARPEPRANTQPQMSGPVLFYTPQVIEHFTHPRHVGEMDPEEATGRAVVGDPGCGDQMKLWIRVEGQRIVDIRFRSYGCPGAIATSSMVTELACGRTLAEGLTLTDDDVIAALGGIPENKRHCSLLGISALRQAIADHLERAEVLRSSPAASPAERAPSP